MATPKNVYDGIAYSPYSHAKEFTQLFINKKALPEVPVTGINYVFFTPPELGVTRSRFTSRGGRGAYSPDNCFENNSRHLKLPDKQTNYDTIYNELIVHTLSGEIGPFMSILSNRAASLPASSEIMSTLDYSETWNRYKIPLGTSTKDSKISGNFEILYKEDADLTIMKIHKLWYDYIEGVFMGRLISPYANMTDMQSAQNAVIDYMASAYVFSLKPDGKTIQYWAKYTGVFPTKNPYEVFAAEDGDMQTISKISMDYQFAYKEDMDINILRDFNLLTQNGTLTDPKGNYFDDAPSRIGRISKYPGIVKGVNNKTSNVVFELHLTDPTNTDGIQTNFKA